jgi:hypothetical protein
MTIEQIIIHVDNEVKEITLNCHSPVLKGRSVYCAGLNTYPDHCNTNDCSNPIHYELGGEG